MTSIGKRGLFFPTVGSVIHTTAVAVPDRVLVVVTRNLHAYTAKAVTDGALFEFEATQGITHAGPSDQCHKCHPELGVN